MQGNTSKGARYETWGTIAALLIYAAAFIIDLNTPRGFIDWFFYFIPLVIGFPLLQSWILVLPFIATPLIIIGLFLSPEGAAFPYVLPNRIAAIITLWIVAFVLKRRRRAVTELRDSEARFRSMFESNSAVMFLIDPQDGRIVDSNKAACNFYGYSCGQLDNMNIRQINALRPEEVKAEYQKAAAEMRTFFVFPHRLASGAIRWVQVYSSPITYHGRQILFSIIHDITEAKRAEEALRESESRYRAFFELLGVGAAEIDPATGRFMRVNEAFSRIIGYSEEELRRLTYVDLTYPEDREADTLNFPRLFRGEIPAYDIQKRYVRKDGRVIWVRISATLVRDPQGKPLRTVGIVLNIDDFKHAQDTVLRERSLLQTIFDSVPVMFTLWDPTLQGIQINKRFERVTGWNQEDALQPGFIAKVYPDSAVREEVENFMRKLTPGYRDLVMTGKTGSRIETSWANIALPDGRRVGIGLDIRERKRSEEALRRAAEHLELAIEAGDEGTWDYDFDNKVFFLGAHSRKILGILPDEPMTDEKFYAIVHPDDRERVRRAVRAVLSPASDGVYNAEFCILRRDGAIRWINARGQVYFQGEGDRKRPARFIGINRDITDRKQAEEILKRDKETFERLVKERSDKLVDAQRELDRSRRLSDIGKLAATIAHELRNPLAAIDLAGASIQRKAQNPSVEKSSENIRKKVGESNRIIDDILYFTRMRAPAFEDVNIYELLRESMKTAKARHPDPRLHVEPDIESLRGAVIHADADHLREVFANLLNNALEAIPEAEEGLVRVTGSFDGNTLEVNVHDNGAGISAESQERLFEPFFSTKKKGTGLGLSVVSQIVKMHKGTITVDSEPGKGTTMTVRIPRNPEELS